MRKPRLPNLILIMILALFVGSCVKRVEKPRIVVGSKNFSEQRVLGEIIAQIIEKHTSYTVVRKFDIGGTPQVHKALISGQIDLYPEYSGTAATDILRLQNTSHDDAELMAAVRREYGRKWNIECLDPLGFNDSFIIAISEDDDRAAHLETLSDAVKDQKIGWRLGVGDEFNVRPDGLSGMLSQYPLRLVSTPKTYNLQELYRALGDGEVDMIAGDATDGLLSRSHAKVLKDDRGFFPPYKAFILVRSDTNRVYPELKPALDLLTGKISDEAIREMNYKVDGIHLNERLVAEEFLKRVGL
jgi:osmoprotectant transport system substrate-binding protein